MRNSRVQRITWVALLLAAVILAMETPVLAQCAMCQGASAAGADGGAVYNRSTLFMLCVPYLLLAGVAGYVVYAFRRARPSSPAGDSIASPQVSSSGSGASLLTAPPGSAATAGDSERSRG